MTTIDLDAIERAARADELDGQLDLRHGKLRDILNPATVLALVARAKALDGLEKWLRCPPDVDATVDLRRDHVTLRRFLLPDCNLVQSCRGSGLNLASAITAALEKAK